MPCSRLTCSPFCASGGRTDIAKACCIVPAGGAEIPTFLSYFIEKKLSKHPEEFGHSAIEGVAGPEAANNAAGAGVFVPLLTLGIPTSATAAIMLSAFQSYGINPGPQLLTSHADLVWTLIASLYIGNVMLLILNLPLVGLWVQILRVPTPYLYGGILIFATVGTYGISRSVFDLAILYGVGVVGFFMRRFDFPTSPVIIGMILGPVAEQQFRRGWAQDSGRPARRCQKLSACNHGLSDQHAVKWVRVNRGKTIDSDRMLACYRTLDGNFPETGRTESKFRVLDPRAP